MLFSVIVPTHHRPKKLKDLLASLDQQTLDVSLFEVILVPSPNDSGIQKLGKYRFPFRILSAEDDPYSGKSASYKRNRGAQEAKAPWLAFIDDDCVADKNWLANAQKRIAQTPTQGIEGLTKIPKPKKMTYTYKGLQRLSKAGGYQTCNMFYLREPFLKVGGFDLHFPFYLEDTDLAWSLLDQGHQIVFDETCIVEHPVPEADVDRLYFNAVRTKLLPYLYKKHKHLFKTQRWKALQRFQWMFLLIHSLLLFWLLSDWNAQKLLIVIMTVFLLSLTYTARQLNGCAFTAMEASKMLFYYTITPWITLIQLWRGNWQQKTFLWR